MVNTFITVPGNFRETAKSLDNSRLNKQCTEAMQIINILVGFRIAEKFLSLPPFPIHQETSKEERERYIDHLWTKMKEKSFSTIEYTTDGRMFGHTDNLKNRVFEESTFFSAGFNKHPATVAWLGFTDGLMYYTNCCLQEWMDRGYQNNRPLYSLHYQDEKDIPLPKWTFDDEVILHIRSTLVEKELTSPFRGKTIRYEPLHYSLMPEFISSFTVFSRNYSLFHLYLRSIEFYCLSNGLNPKTEWHLAGQTENLLSLKSIVNDGYLWK